jgi:hypothetical protein
MKTLEKGLNDLLEHMGDLVIEKTNFRKKTICFKMT